MDTANEDEFNIESDQDEMSDDSGKQSLTISKKKRQKAKTKGPLYSSNDEDVLEETCVEDSQAIVDGGEACASSQLTVTEVNADTVRFDIDALNRPVKGCQYPSGSLMFP